MYSVKNILNVANMYSWMHKIFLCRAKHTVIVANGLHIQSLALANNNDGRLGLFR